MSTQNKQIAEPPLLIDIVEAHVNKRLHYWRDGIYVYHLFNSDGYGIDIWNRCAGYLIYNNWYGWTELDKPLIPINAANPRFLRQIMKDCRNAFVRSGEAIHWNRPTPTK